MVSDCGISSRVAHVAFRSLLSAMSFAAQLPEHKLSETPNSRTIEIGDWVITARTNPISNAGELDALQATLLGMPLPEMTFGNNTLELEHKRSGWKYAFGTADALRGVKNGELADGDGGVKVGYAEAWLKSRCVLLRDHIGLNVANGSRTGESSQLPMPKTVNTKPYDWTYTTIYSGHSRTSSSNWITWQEAESENPQHEIPLAELTRQDPILFYAEIPLFEDELHDNGASHLLTRIVSLH